MHKGSKISPLLTLDYIQHEDENKYFDRKSAQIRVKDLAPLISAFANADGGTIVLGISDKKRKLEGVNSVGEDKINNFINAPKDLCKPMPKYREEFIEIENDKGESDRLLLLHIFSSVDQIIRTVDDRTFLRIGDKKKEILGENLRNLEYAKNAIHYEDGINQYAQIEDLDEDLLREYQKRIEAEDVSIEQMLSARGFLVMRDGEKHLTNAAVLLFAKNVRQFYPNCRIRFIRYDGTSAKVGTRMNIIKDHNIEYPILKIIDKSKEYLATQFREFTALNPETGLFETVPEYPEFAWQEGIVNAVTHREYAMMGNYILVTMYDDRLEIESPGKLPNVVTVENIRETRFSRNPTISRVLTEMGWVRELNEGVKRIYADMKGFFLDQPEYSEPNFSVKLTLKNNIEVRKTRQNEHALQNLGEALWHDLDDLERQIVAYMTSHGGASRTDLEKHLGKSNRTVIKRINHLMQLGVIKARGDKHDPKRSYEMIFKENKYQVGIK